MNVFKTEFTSREKRENKRHDIKNDVDLENYIEKIPSNFRMIEKTINPFQDHWEYRYYKYLFGKDYCIKDICNNYIDGLKWVFNYYIGNEIDFTYKYNYDYGPLLKDLKTYFPHFEMKTSQKINDYNIKPFKDTTQLAYVLPYKDLNLLPIDKEEYMKDFYDESPDYHTNNMVNALIWLSYSDLEKKKILDDELEDYFR